MRTLVLLLIAMVATPVFAQVRLTWTTFELLEFEEVFDEPSASWLQTPIWTTELRAWEGKEVKITGYVIALDVDSKEYALSAFPFASCFFCGAAGPESVIELNLQEPQKFTTDDVVTFMGVLQLNSDPLKFPLTLLQARPK